MYQGWVLVFAPVVRDACACMSPCIARDVLGHLSLVFPCSVYLRRLQGMVLTCEPCVCVRGYLDEASGCVRACARACVRACVRACARALARACVRACVPPQGIEEAVGETRLLIVPGYR
jgi:hypothetical protein